MTEATRTMPTVEQRLHQWQQELLDLSNRNRLLNFRPSTTRPSSVHLVAPHASELYVALGQGKRLVITGTDPVDDVEQAPPSTDELTGAAEETATTAAAAREARPGTTRSSVPLERTNRVALRLLT